jgi:hypothetical protein
METLRLPDPEPVDPNPASLPTLNPSGSKGSCSVVARANQHNLRMQGISYNGAGADCPSHRGARKGLKPKQKAKWGKWRQDATVYTGELTR